MKKRESKINYGHHKVFTYIMLTYSPLNFQFSRAGEREKGETELFAFIFDMKCNAKLYEIITVFLKWINKDGKTNGYFVS